MGETRSGTKEMARREPRGRRRRSRHLGAPRRRRPEKDHGRSVALTVLDESHDAGRTIVLISHEPDVSARADRLIELFDGQIQSDERQTAVGRHAVGAAP
jgi:hypothetical protein